jgi:uncharacterized protein
MRADAAPTLAHGRIIDSAFRPHPLLRGAHVQTLAASLLRPLPPLDLRIERLELPDGDFVDLGWCGEQHAGGPIAVLVHGLTGGFESKYLRATARRLIGRGFRCVVLQLRGAGPEPNRSAHCYNHGDTADLRFLWHWLRAREPQTPLVSAGWSLGANVTLKALAEEGAQAPVRGAAVACAPFQLQPCAERLRRGFSRLYQAKLLKELKAGVRRKHGPLAVPAGVNLAATLQAADFFAFDDAYIAPLLGYRDALDYYARCSSGPFLQQVQVPTLVVHALDDPFMTPDVVPPAAALAPAVTLELSRHGGHVGFIAADPRGLPWFWLDQRISAVLAGYLGR